MDVTVLATTDPRQVLDQAEEFLVSEPVLSNVILTLLQDRCAQPEPGRYWIGEADGKAAGVVFQSPLDFSATITPMPVPLVGAVVDAIAAAGIRLPGVSGEAAVAARFAGQWSERCKSAAAPVLGTRIYQAGELIPPRGVPGALSQGTAADQELLVPWLDAFSADIGHGEPSRDTEAHAARRLAAGQVWFWRQDAGAVPVSMAIGSGDVAGVARIQTVYTPPELRGRGYAAACVAALTGRVLGRGLRCILYTNLANPVSNSVYRRIGYQAVAEGLGYKFS